MLSYLLRRFSVLIPTWIGVSIIAFSLIYLMEGDPATVMMGERGGSPEQRAAMMEAWGLDKPLPVQYFVFLKNAAMGDLNRSIVSQRPVVEEFFDRFVATLELGLAAMLLAILLGVPAGILAAVRKNSIFDFGLMGVSVVGYSMPIFWLGLLLIMFFSVHLGWTPVSGRIGVIYDVEPITGFMLIDTLLSEEGFPAFWDALRHLALPAIAMGTIPLAVITRMTRSSLLEVLSEDYIRTAEAKGLSKFRVIWIHGLRNAMIPVITVIGLMFGTIITGAILTETIFSWPGIGKWIVRSITSLDVHVIRGGILLISTMVVVINLCVDMLYAVINPRMRGKT